MIKYSFSLLLALILCNLGCSIDKTKTGLKNSQPNVLLILTDNQSYYELSCTGHSVVKTPNIDRFAKEGVVFDNFYATPYCSPSRAEMLTGRYALRYGIHSTIGGVSNLAPSEKLVSDYLKEKGYINAVFGKWHLGNQYPQNPIYRGFDKSFIHDGGGIGQLPDYYGNTHIDAHYNNNDTIVPSKGFSSDVLFQEAQKFMKTNKEKPFFCFVSTPATHLPWQAHPEKSKDLEARGVKGEGHEMALYSMIENIDDNVGRLLDFVEESGLKKNTLVIIATDQGMKYRGLDNPPKEKNFGLPEEVFDNRHKVFCMMQYPKLSKSAFKSEALSGIVDIAPTILDVCGIDVPSDMDGRSLKPLLVGKKNWDDDRVLIVQCPRQRKREKYKNASVKTKKWRLINGELLFDAVNDPAQLNNVAVQYPEVIDSLNKIHNEFWNSLPAEEDVRLWNYIGAKEQPQTRLNAMDWYKGDAPWQQAQIKAKDLNGTWAVEVVQSGQYRFELRHFPREHPESIGATKALIQVGEKNFNRVILPEDDKVVFEMQLEKGQYDLSTKFENSDGQTWGAKFVYVKYQLCPK